MGVGGGGGDLLMSDVKYKAKGKGESNTKKE